MTILLTMNQEKRLISGENARMDKMVKNKEASFQYLKIIAMIMIVFHHLIAKNVFNIDTQVIGITANKIILQILGNNALIGNNLFFWYQHGF